MIRDQGISKAGNRRVRALRIQLAGLWLRYQPDSKHSCWFQERFGGGRKRQRRIGIVALAQRLLIDLWRFVESGVVPDVAGAEGRMRDEVTGCEPARIEGGQGTGSAHPDRHRTLGTVRTEDTERGTVIYPLPIGCR